MELDILNTNISTAINEATKTQTLSAKTLATNVNEPETQSNQCNGELSEDEEVCEICPICREQAYGTTVQCGECGDWYHFECIKADENTFRALADDDFICRSCSDGLLYDNNKQDSTVNEDGQLSQTNNDLLSLVDVELDNERSVSQTDIHNISIEHSVNSMPTQIPKEKTSAAPVKPKVKKPVKTNKLKKEEVPDKSYILELESQVGMLKSTIDLYKKRNDQLVNQNRNADTQEHVYSGPETNRTEHECKHRCCTELAEKIQDNRIRLLETQIMQNMYINNAMHLQLVSQMRSSYPVPVMQCDPRVYGYNGIHCHPPNAWTHTPYSNVPYGHYQPVARHVPLVPTYNQHPNAQPMPTPGTQTNSQQTTGPSQPTVKSSNPTAADQLARDLHSGGSQTATNLPTTVVVPQPLRKRHLTTDIRMANGNDSNEQTSLGIRHHAGGKQQCLSSEVPQEKRTPCVVDLTGHHDTPRATKETENQTRQDGLNNSGPSFAGCVNNESVDNSHESFLSIPRVKHNPPELLQQIQRDEVRELV